MRPHAALLVGALVLLGGCLGGGGVIGGATDGQTTQAAQTTTIEDAETNAMDAAKSHAESEPTTAADENVTDENVTATFVVEGRENQTVTLEVADTADERKEGLMHRQSLPENHGMLFVYADADRRSFWMKNTHVPLDIIFVAPNGTVLNVEHATPGPEDEGQLDRYRSDGDAQYVVELERGFANRTGVQAGTKLVFNDSAPEAEDEGWL